MGGFGIGLFVVFIVLLALVGLAVVALRGSRRLQLSAPACAKCGYAIREVAVSGSKHCPECGNDLDGPSGIAFAQRRTRRWPIVITVVLVLLPVGILLLGGIFMFRASQAAIRARAQAAAAAAQLQAVQQAPPTNAFVAALAAGSQTPALWDQMTVAIRARTLDANNLGMVASAVTQGCTLGTLDPQQFGTSEWTCIRTLLRASMLRYQDKQTLMATLGGDIEVTSLRQLAPNAPFPVQLGQDLPAESSLARVAIVHGLTATGPDGTTLELSPVAGGAWPRLAHGLDPAEVITVPGLPSVGMWTLEADVEGVVLRDLRGDPARAAIPRPNGPDRALDQGVSNGRGSVRWQVDVVRSGGA